MTEAGRPLWAPWRIEFIRSKKENSCFLCGKEKAGRSQEEPLIIARLEYNFVIMNRYPYNSGHILIAPYRHIGDIASLSKEELYEMSDICVKGKELLQKIMFPDGFNIGFNLGIAAGAGVADHIHMHIVPRWVGDTNFMPVIGDTRVVPEAIEKTAELLRSEWK